MKLPRQITKWWPLALVVGFLGAIGWFGIQIIHAAAEPFWKHIAPAIPQTLLLSLCCLVSLIAILEAIWIVYLHRLHREPPTAEASKAFHDQFVEPMDPRGFWLHKTKQGFFCPNCKM